MDEKYEIVYLPLFYEDLDKITDYIIFKLGNKIAAENLLDEIEEKINKRAYDPEGYEEYKSLKNRKYAYYRIYVKNYVVFYTVRDNIMEVSRILYSRRNFKKLI